MTHYIVFFSLVVMGILGGIMRAAVIGVIFCTPLYALADGTFLRNLGLGASGDDVRLLQEMLNDNEQTRLAETGVGSAGNETGYFGPRTRDAVRRFQELHRGVTIAILGLTSGTGWVGPLTRAALDNIARERVAVNVYSLPISDLDAHEHKAGEADPPHSKWFDSTAFVVAPSDMWITSFVPMFIGTNKELLHHMTLYKFGVGLERPVCPNEYKQSRELVSTSLNTASDIIGLPAGYGMRLGTRDPLFVEVMVHNPEPPLGPGLTVTDGRIGMRVVGKMVKLNDGMRETEFFRLKIDDTPCQEPYRHEAFRVPSSTPEFIKRDDSGGTASSSGSYRFTRDGTIIGFGANFWPMKGGRSMRALINDKKIAEMNGEHYDQSTPWAWRIPILQNIQQRVNVGDTISAEALYVNPTDHVVPDASGMLAFFFAPETVATSTTSTY
jgi:hypothetical protein